MRASSQHHDRAGEKSGPRTLEECDWLGHPHRAGRDAAFPGGCWGGLESTVSPKQSQVKVEIYHHKRADESVEPIKKLVFILDEVKVKEEGEKGAGKGKKKKVVPCQGQPFTQAQLGAEAYTIKNFGSVLDITTLKSAEKLQIGWRCRCDPLPTIKRSRLAHS